MFPSSEHIFVMLNIPFCLSFVESISLTYELPSPWSYWFYILWCCSTNFCKIEHTETEYVWMGTTTKPVGLKESFSSVICCSFIWYRYDTTIKMRRRRTRIYAWILIRLCTSLFSHSSSKSVCSLLCVSMCCKAYCVLFLGKTLLFHLLSMKHC